MTSRLDLSIHREMCALSTINTLRYTFFHMRCGIYVMIRNNEVVIFCPFLNRDYRNTWGDSLKMNSSTGKAEEYYDEKAKLYRRENYLQDVSQWLVWLPLGIVDCIIKSTILGGPTATLSAMNIKVSQKRVEKQINGGEIISSWFVFHFLD